jgi:sorbitol-specific phosphotransferase system component IIC
MTSAGKPGPPLVVRLLLGAGCGLLVCIPAFLALMYAMMSSHEGSLQNPLVLLAAPLYALLYIVVVITHLVPAGVAMGAVAAFCATLSRVNIGYALVALLSILWGGWVGWRFVDICLEGTDTQTDRVVGACVAAAVFAAGNLLICHGIQRLGDRTESRPVL